MGEAAQFWIVNQYPTSKAGLPPPSVLRPGGTASQDHREAR
jgi:hypothetical protein